MTRSKFREASFSSYLNGAEDTFALELREAGEHETLEPYIPRERDSSIYLGKNRAAEDREIEVFDAKKYFNEDANPRLMAVNKESPPHRKEDHVQGGLKTPSLRSESSCNSKSALFHAIPVNKQVQKRVGRSFLAGICSCGDRNSVEVRDFTGESSDLSVKKFHDHGNFTFPVYDSGNHGAADSPKRKPPVVEKTKNGLSLEKKLTMLTWDAPVPGVGEEIRIPSFSSDLNNDSDSDASSDLFEIESLSKGNAYLSRQASDGMSDSVTAVNWYAPSEASIEWSVVTASAADFSVFSDFEELRSGTTTTTTSGAASMVPDPLKLGLDSKNIPRKEASRRHPGILSGCKSQKAVRVAGEVHRASYKGISNSRNLHRSEKCTQTPQVRNEKEISRIGCKMN